nr:hypothetical protein [uncultured Agathobacter sp.]
MKLSCEAYPASNLGMGIDKGDITNVSDSSTGDTVSGQLYSCKV